MLIAALLSGFVGYTGAARFYLGYIANGVGMIIYFFIGPCFLFCLGALISAQDKELGTMFSGCVGVLYVLAGFAWWLYELIIIATGQLPAANQVKLE